MINIPHIEQLNLEGLGWALIHFLWQGALIGLIASALLLALRNRSAESRYFVASTAMAACLVAFIATVLVLNDSSDVIPDETSVASVSNVHSTELQSPGQEASSLAPGTEMIAPTDVVSPADPDAPAGEMLATLRTTNTTTMQIVAIMWILGILLMAARFTRQYLGTRRLRRSGVSDPDPGSARLFTKIRKNLGIDPAVRLFQSTLADTPMVVGWFRPVVLMPISVLSSLDEEELTLVFLHELTHIRRQDHLLNLIQSVVEIVLFYHPIVWWLSRQIRIEREHCCDDTMLRQGTEPGRLARTLFKLESMRVEHASTTQMILKASGGNFMQRITRLVENSSTKRSSTGHRTPLAIILGSFLAAGCLANIGIANVTTPVERVQEREGAQDSDRSRGERSKERTRTDAFPSTEAVEERLAQAYKAGDITREQFGDAMKLHERFLMGIESGRMTSEEAARGFRERMGAMMGRGGNDEASRRGEQEDREDPRASRMGAMMIQLGKALESGEITPEQALERVMGAAKRMQMNVTDEKKLVDQRQARAQYAEAAAKMTAMVKAGEITKEQMQKRLDEMRRRMSGDAGSKRGMSKAEYDKAVAEMVEMVKSGKITREQMQERLDQMNKAMKDGESNRKFSEADIKAAYEKMQKMVEAGEITREQMDQRLAEMKGMMDKSSDSERKMKLEYERAVAKMTEMVRNGEMTRQQMQERLDRMRMEMSSDR
jgi:beta-lactamase regulating signal transducer with metallopeptidase domain